MHGLLDFIHASNACSSKEELTALFTRFIASYGYNRFTMGFLQGNHRELTEKEKAFGLMVNYPEEWLIRYMSEHYLIDDPVYKKCRAPGAPFTWKEALMESPTPRAIRLMSEAKEYGLVEGIGLSFYQRNNKIIGFGLSSSEAGARTDANAMTELRLACIHCFEVYACLDGFYSKEVPEKPLSPREREVLHWTALGLSKTETAEKMKVSVSCVKRYCESCNKKLKTTNATSAVLKAYRLGEIDP